jgi:hypothetical protein
MSLLKSLLPALLALPLSAQAWDLRLEIPFPQGQNLPQALISGTGTLIRQQSLDTGNGFTFTASHRIIRVGPVLKLEWGAEYSQWKADGQVLNGSASTGSTLKQSGLGVGLNAQFWVPFTGVAGELGVMERLQNYKIALSGVEHTRDLARPWLRVGLRYSLPLPVINPYLAASYQQPITKDKPVAINSVADIAGYLGAQGSGQEFQRMWTFGVGVAF